MSGFKPNKKPYPRHSAVSFSSNGWASLPALFFFFFLILDKLLEPIDHVRFASVCKEWHSLSKAYNLATERWRKVLPMLLIPNHHNDDRTVDRTVQGLVVALRNPFRRVDPIRLPPLDPWIPNRDARCYEYYVRMVILSADPTLNRENYVVVALYHSFFKLAFFKAGQNAWTFIKQPLTFGDIIFYKSQVCTGLMCGEVLSLVVNGSNNPSLPVEVKRLTPEKPFTQYCRHAYLVGSTKGDLLHVLRFYWPREGDSKSKRWQTRRFMVYKWVSNDEDGSSILHKIELKSMGDEALFVGDNHSISVLASNFLGCHPNSIYYTDDFVSGNPGLDDDEPCDMGIFNLEEGTITQHYSLHSNSQRAIWVVPPFDGLY